MRHQSRQNKQLDYVWPVDKKGTVNFEIVETMSSFLNLSKSYLYQQI